jgi:predicted nucleic acid-binding protein
MAQTPRVFLDASVLIAAAASPSGGSALVAGVCKAGLATPLVSRLVLWEAERNLRSKFPANALLEFYRLLGELEPQVVPDPTPAAIRKASAVIPAKDAHVLAGARLGKATHLLTLDRRHLLGPKTREAILPIVVCTPGEFLRVVVQ